ncbi:hypothetical protein [Kribbella sp. VKM Ac-2569]|uniref:hypothetical protein n=1 Tax=Kribbella sp. VKM Ac-2569 TaxID=2512220 RepID=UPI0013004822|nr:hypothetical protein [Kribbella sp. VKM Ac-2569]
MQATELADRSCRPAPDSGTSYTNFASVAVPPVGSAGRIALDRVELLALIECHIVQLDRELADRLDRGQVVQRVVTHSVDRLDRGSVTLLSRPLVSYVYAATLIGVHTGADLVRVVDVQPTLGQPGFALIVV